MITQSEEDSKFGGASDALMLNKGRKQISLWHINKFEEVTVFHITDINTTYI